MRLKAPDARGRFGLALVLAAVLFLSAGAEAWVFITPSGARYHREDCVTLRNSSRVSAVTIDEAVNAGRTPCAVCNPPPPDGETTPGTSAAAREGAAGSALYRVDIAIPGDAISGDAIPGAASSRADVSRMVSARVSRHVDGDTVRVSIPDPPPGLNHTETIRMIGVDTPETVHPTRQVEYFGREASDYTKSRLLGQTVLLAFDRELRDRYGRLLCYLYTGAGCFNAELIREGYAHAYTRFPFHFLEEFRELERGARAAGRGLWGVR
ncbi:MAG: thermonuclease family protein [Spirochaetaceae bacterium]|nr:thermonuclease family protein [Spirochaetaceae bacterium]